jgi:CheY-specific phosphatase CheX
VPRLFHGAVIKELNEARLRAQKKEITAEMIRGMRVKDFANQSKQMTERLSEMIAGVIVLKKDLIEEAQCKMLLLARTQL